MRSAFLILGACLAAALAGAHAEYASLAALAAHPPHADRTIELLASDGAEFIHALTKDGHPDKAAISKYVYEAIQHALAAAAHGEQAGIHQAHRTKARHAEFIHELIKQQLHRGGDHAESDG